MSENAEIYVDGGKWKLAVRQNVIGSDGNPCFAIRGIFESHEDALEALAHAPKSPEGPLRTFDQFMRHG